MVGLCFYYGSVFNIYEAGGSGCGSLDLYLHKVVPFICIPCSFGAVSKDTLKVICSILVFKYPIDLQACFV